MRCHASSMTKLRLLLATDVDCSRTRACGHSAPVKKASRRSPRHGDRAEYLASDTDLGHGWWCCMRRSGCVHRGSLKIEARAWPPRAAVVSRSTRKWVQRWWTEASMHPTLSAQDVADFVADFVADPSPRTWSEAYGLWRQTGPTVRGQTCATGGSACAASASARANAAAAPGASTADATRAERGHDVHKGSGSVPGWRRSAGTTT